MIRISDIIFVTVITSEGKIAQAGAVVESEISRWLLAHTVPFGYYPLRNSKIRTGEEWEMSRFGGFSQHQRFGAPGGGVVTKIIVANALVFLLQIILIRTPFDRFMALSPRLVLTRGYVWQLVTYMFLHGDLFHLAINMFIIWMFGRTLEQVWGSSRFLKFYFACGIGGAVFSFVFAYGTAVIGASAAAYGILLAFGILFPNQQLLLWFILPVRARTLVIVLAILELIKGLSISDGIAHFAHLGGMAAALLLLRGDYQFRRLGRFFSGLVAKSPIKFSFDRNEGSGDYDTEKIDSILDKISEKGYENLSETEKRILEKYSEENDDGE
jgi:membrane associated rhomboid family serine protease